MQGSSGLGDTLGMGNMKDASEGDFIHTTLLCGGAIRCPLLNPYGIGIRVGARQLRVRQPGGADKPQDLPIYSERAELMSFGTLLHPG